MLQDRLAQVGVKEVADEQYPVESLFDEDGSRGAEMLRAGNRRPFFCWWVLADQADETLMLLQVLEHPWGNEATVT